MTFVNDKSYFQDCGCVDIGSSYLHATYAITHFLITEWTAELLNLGSILVSSFGLCWNCLFWSLCTHYIMLTTRMAIQPTHVSLHNYFQQLFLYFVNRRIKLANAHSLLCSKCLICSRHECCKYFMNHMCLSLCETCLGNCCEYFIVSFCFRVHSQDHKIKSNHIDIVFFCGPAV